MRTTDMDLFDDTDLIEVADPIERVQRSPSTPATRARYAELKRRRVGDVWVEDGCWYVMGKSGVTVLKP